MLFDDSAKILADRKKYFGLIKNLTVTGVSDWMRKEGIKTIFANRPSMTIYNGVDLQVFKPTKSNLRAVLNLEGKYVIMGPFSKWLSEVNKPIFRYFTENLQEDECLLLFGATRQIIDLPKNVKLIGYTKIREELAALYTMADVFVNCTREESLSLINVEAQACGTPVITFDNTGVAETVDGINSLRVDTGNAPELFNAVNKIRMKKTSSNEIVSFVSENFDIEKNYKKYIDLYRSL